MTTVLRLSRVSLRLERAAMMVAMVLVIASLPQPLVSVGAEQPLSVCRVLSRTDHLRGKMIQVTGVMIGSMHGSALYDASEAECAQLRRRDIRWPAGIYLVWPSQRTVEDGPRTFEPDVDGIERNLAPIRLRIKERDDLLVTATFLGELRARNAIQISWNPHDGGWFGGDGYGHLGQYPAQLVIKTVTDAKTIDRQSWQPRSEEVKK